MTGNPSSQNRRQPVAWLFYAANLLFVLSLFPVRATRIEGSDTAYWSPPFIGLLAGVLVLSALTVWATHTGLMRRTVSRWDRSRRAAVIVGWILASYTALIFVPAVFPFFQPYLLPFVVWLTCINGGLLMMSLTMDAPRASTPAGAAGRLGKLAAAAAAFLLPVIALEIGLRLWFTYFGSEHDRAAYTYTGEQIAERQSLYRGEPYTNYGLSPNYPDHNSLGYRGPEITQPKPDGVFRIVALGGSTTYGIGLPWRQAYPAQLESILREEYGYSNVEVINGGVMMYTSWDLLASFEYRVLDLDPDMVIIYEGINDVIARLVDPASYNGQNPLRGTWRSDYPSLSPSVLYRFVAINLGWMADPTDLSQQFRVRSDIRRCVERDFCADLQLTPEQVLAANPPVYYQRNLDNLIAVARNNHVQVMLSSWAYYPGSGVGVDPFITYDYVRQAVGEHNAIVRELAGKWALPYYDLLGSMPHDISLWLDGFHMSAAGAREQARQYAAFLAENELLPAPGG